MLHIFIVLLMVFGSPALGAYDETHADLEKIPCRGAYNLVGVQYVYASDVEDEDAFTTQQYDNVITKYGDGTRVVLVVMGDSGRAGKLYTTLHVDPSAPDRREIIRQFMYTSGCNFTVALPIVTH